MAKGFKLDATTMLLLGGAAVAVLVFTPIGRQLWATFDPKYASTPFEGDIGPAPPASITKSMYARRYYR